MAVKGNIGEGSIFGEWVVISKECIHKKSGNLWECRCSCGTVKLVKAASLYSGVSKCCRTCSYKTRTEPGRGYKHLSPHWDRYGGMLSRCNTPTAIMYHRYGALGIKIYQPWVDNFWEYHDYIENVLGKKPEGDYSIDRIDSKGNYEPGNLRWLDRVGQNNNKTGLIEVTYKGFTSSLQYFCKENSLNYKKCFRYYKKHGTLPLEYFLTNFKETENV
jgi:hypothetical protein